MKNDRVYPCDLTSVVTRVRKCPAGIVTSHNGNSDVFVTGLCVCCVFSPWWSSSRIAKTVGLGNDATVFILNGSPSPTQGGFLSHGFMSGSVQVKNVFFNQDTNIEMTHSEKFVGDGCVSRSQSIQKHLFDIMLLKFLENFLEGFSSHGIMSGSVQVTMVFFFC